MQKEIIQIINAEIKFIESACVEFLKVPLNKMVLLELTQTYLVLLAKEMYPENNWDISLDNVSIYKEDIANKIRGYLSQKLFKNHCETTVKFLNLDNENEIKPLVSQILIDLEITNNKGNEIISVENSLSFIEVKCNEFLSAGLSESSKNELIQSYFLIQCLKSVGLDVYNKNGQKKSLSSNFNNILNYEDDIEKKIKHINIDELMSSILALKKILVFSPENEQFIAGKIYCEIMNKLEVDQGKYGNFIMFVFNNAVIFQENVCQKFLKSKLDEPHARELVQAYFVFKAMEYYPDTFKINNIVLTESVQNIEKYKGEIINYLYGKLTEEELDKYINLFNDVGIHDKEKENIFHEMSIELNAKVVPRFSNNDIIVFEINNSKNNKRLTGFSFDERSCQKALAKEKTNDSLRELCQSYFVHMYMEKIGTFRNTSGEYISISSNMERINNYIDQIYEKLNGVIDVAMLDANIKIVTDMLGFTKEEENKMNIQVINPIKRSLGLKAPSLYKHLL